MDEVRIGAALIARSDMVHAVIARVKALINAPSLDEGVPKALRIVVEAPHVDRWVIVESVGRPGAPPNMISFYQRNRSDPAPLTLLFIAERIKHPDGASRLALLGEGEPVAT